MGKRRDSISTANPHGPAPAPPPSLLPGQTWPCEYQQLLELLGVLSAVPSSPRGLRQTMEALLDCLLTITRMDAGAVYLRQPNQGLMRMTAHRGFSNQYLAAMETVVIGRGFSGRAAQSREVRFSQERQNDSRFVRPASALEGFKSFVSVPFVSQRQPGDILGVLNMAGKSQSGLSSDVIDLLRRVSVYAGEMLSNYRLSRLLEQRERWADGLYRIGVEMRSVHDVAQICRLIADEARMLFNCDLCMVSADVDAMQQHVFVSAGDNDDALKELIPPLRSVLAKASGSVTLEGPLLTRVFGDERPTRGISSLCAAPAAFDDRRPYGWIAIAYGTTRDLTEERKILERLSNEFSAALRNAELYRSLEELAAVKERNWLAREMHDTLAQLLGACRLEVLHAVNLLKTERQAEGMEHLKAVDLFVAQAHDELRHVMLGLRTPVGLGQSVEALRTYLSYYERQSGIQVVSLLPESLDLSPALEVQLVRVIQEALTNVRRHAGASQVQVQLAIHGERLRLSIRDNGVGFSPERLPDDRPRFGLQVMRERALSVGASLQIDSAPGRGTEVRGEFPLNVGTPERPLTALRHRG